MRILLLCLSSVTLLSACVSVPETRQQQSDTYVQLGPRPAYLTDQLNEGKLKQTLSQCINSKTGYNVTEFSIGHRGAPLMFPEHTKESYLAAARMGAGILECDVALTKDGELVCRHSHADLHTTTNVLATDLAHKCTQPFIPADKEQGLKATAECRTSDFTLKEYLSLKGKMDAFDPDATSVEEYMDATPAFRTDLYTEPGTLMSHKDSIALFQELGVKMTPELKKPDPKDLAAAGLTQADFARQLIQDYIDAGINPENVYPQSFLIDDLQYWQTHFPDFARQAVYLIYSTEHSPSPAEIKAKGINIVAPIYTLLVEQRDGVLTATDYAREISQSGLDIIAWSLERRYTDYNELEVLAVLKNEVGVMAVFSDWPATTTFFDNCVE